MCMGCELATSIDSDPLYSLQAFQAGKGYLLLRGMSQHCCRRVAAAAVVPPLCLLLRGLAPRQQGGHGEPACGMNSVASARMPPPLTVRSRPGAGAGEGGAWGNAGAAATAAGFGGMANVAATDPRSTVIRKRCFVKHSSRIASASSALLIMMMRSP